MVYVYIATFNVKRLEEVEELGRNECTLHRWPSSPVMSHCSRPYQVYNTGNGASLQKLPDKSHISGKR